MARDETDETDWSEPLGRAVSQLLAEEGQTQKWLAQQIGMDPATASRIVKGQHTLTVNQLARIAQALGVTRQSILGRAGYLEGNNPSVVDLDALPPMARRMVLAAVRTALDEAAQQHVGAFESGRGGGDEDA